MSLPTVTVTRKSIYETRRFSGRHTFFALDAEGERVTVDIPITIEINLALVAKLLARRAWDNKSKASSELRGAVKLKIREENSA
jgi:hypothetical protein